MSTIEAQSLLHDKHQITKSIGWQETTIGLALLSIGVPEKNQIEFIISLEVVFG